MARGIQCLLGFVAVFSVVTTNAEDSKPITPEAVKLGRAIDFDKDIKPILTANCLACHNKSDHESDFIIETVEQMKKGGATEEPGIVVGKPDESYLYKLAAHLEEPVMPPMPNDVGAKKLTPRQVGLLKQWILEGARAGATGSGVSLDWQSPASSLQSVYSLALSEWGQQLVVGRANRLFVYDMTDLDRPQLLTDPALAGLKTPASQFPNDVAHLDFVNSLAFHPNGTMIASGGYRVVKLWEREQPTQLAEIKPGGDIKAIATSHAGNQFALVTSEKQLRIFDANGKPTGKPIALNDDQATSVAFTLDDAALLIGSKTKAVSIWDLASGKQVGTFETTSPVTHIISAAGNQIVTGHEDGILRVWPTPTPEKAVEKPTRELKGHNQPITVLKAFPTSRNQIISGGNDGRARYWDITNGRQLREFNHGGQITAISVSNDGSRIATASTSNQIFLWDSNGKKLTELRGAVSLNREVTAHGETLTVRKSQRALADADVKAAEKDVKDREESLKKSNEAKVAAEKELQEAKKKEQEEKKKVDDAQSKLKAKPDDKNLKKAVDNAEKNYKTAADNLKAAERKKSSAERSIKLEEQALVAAREKVKTTKSALVQADNRQKESEAALQAAQKIANDSRKTFRSLEFAPVGFELVSGNDNGFVDVWNGQSGQPTSIINQFGQPVQTISSVSNSRRIFQVDAQTIAVWSNGGTWKLKAVIGPNTPKPVDLAGSFFEDRITALDFGPDGKKLAIGGGVPSRSGQVHIWNVEIMKLDKTLKDPHSDSVTSVRFSRDGSQLLTAATDKFAKIFDVATGGHVRSFEGHTEHVLAADWQADQSTIATAGADKAIKVWNTRTGEQNRTISNYSKQVTALHFVGTSGNIVSCGGDQNVKLHTASNGRNYRSFSGMSSFGFAAAVSRDESTVIAGGQNGDVLIWDGKNGRLLRKLEPPASTSKEVATANGK